METGAKKTPATDEVAETSRQARYTLEKADN